MFYKLKSIYFLTLKEITGYYIIFMLKHDIKIEKINNYNNKE